MKVTPFEVYQTYLSFKNHFTKEKYDYFKYSGKTNASLNSFNKRRDKYFFEKMSRQKNDDEIKAYFLSRINLARKTKQSQAEASGVKPSQVKPNKAKQTMNEMMTK